MKKAPRNTEDLEWLAHQFRWARIGLNLRVIDVVRESDCDDIKEGCRKLRGIESGSPQTPADYRRFASALDIDWDDLCGELDKRQSQHTQRWHQDLPPRRLGSLLASIRRRRDLSVEDVVARTQDIISPERLQRLEGGSDRLLGDDEIEALACALDIDAKSLRGAAADERRVYDERGDKPRLILRGVPGFYVEIPLPTPASTAAYLDYAARLAREKNKSVCLVFGDNRSVYFDSHGTRRESHRPPSMKLD